MDREMASLLERLKRSQKALAGVVLDCQQEILRSRTMIGDLEAMSGFRETQMHEARRTWHENLEEALERHRSD